MRVVVTGAAGGVGRALIPQLCSQLEISQVIGIDQVPSVFQHFKFSFRLADIRKPDFEGAFSGADAVVHLAFAVTQGKMSVQQMRANNVEGSLNVFGAARSSRVGKLVNLSSCSVYGSGEDLTESAPIKPSRLFPYACQKAELEAAATAEFDDIEIIHLRSTFILGPGASPFLRKMCKSRIYLKPPQPHPRIQVVHEHDVATAIVACLRPEVRAGAFNIAASETVTIPELIRNGRSMVFGIPMGVVERLAGPPPQDGSARPLDAGLELLRVPLTVSCQRAREVLGWTPRYGVWEARASMV
jgi:UDP-glucose 4-epimerase